MAVDPRPLPRPIPDAAYEAIDARRFRSSALTRGPWHAEHQHAGPPIALACRAFEQAAQAHGLTHVARVTANLVRPVPIGDLSVDISADYVGRNAAHFSARMNAGTKEVGRFTALVQRESAIELPGYLPGHPAPTMTPGPDEAQEVAFPFAGAEVGYADLVQTHRAHGEMFNGPCAIWFRLRRPLVLGEAPSGYQRVAVAADSGNGISAVLDYRKFLFVNSDTTINLLHRPVGEWVCLDAKTHWGPNGCGLAESALFDVQGLVGRATQSLSIRERLPE